MKITGNFRLNGSFRVGPPAASGGDPYWDNVSLLLSFDSIDGSRNTPDTSTNSNTVTLGLNAEIVNVGGVRDPKYGDGAVFLSDLNKGSSESSVLTPYVASLYDWWNDDYTVEGWVRAVGPNSWNVWEWAAAFTGPKFIANSSTEVNFQFGEIVSHFCWGFGPKSGGALEFAYWDTTGNTLRTVTSSSSVLVYDTWHHISMTHTVADGSIKLFVDGVLVQSGTRTGTPKSDELLPFTFGRVRRESVAGLFDDVRITKGIARYTENFTPPTEPFPTN